MTSSSSSASSSSSSVDRTLSTNLYPLHIEKKEPKKDWVKIAAIVAAVIGGLLIVFAFVSMKGMLPTQILSTPLAKGLTLIAGGAFAAPAAFVLIHRWKNPLPENEG